MMLVLATVASTWLFHWRGRRRPVRRASFMGTLGTASAGQSFDLFDPMMLFIKRFSQPKVSMWNIAAS
jgi:hypothetical protein